MILILLIMFCALFNSSYDSANDVLCTLQFIVWFCWWCSVLTWHRGMIPLMMFCSHIAWSYDSSYWRCSVHASHWLYDSTDDVQCTHHIVFWFHRWCSGLTSSRPYDSGDDNNSYNTWRLWFQKRVHMFTRHKSYDSSDDPMCTHRTAAYDSEIILCNQITAQ